MSFECGDASTDRGQAFTLESVLAAVVVVAGLVFALQAVTVTPSTTGSTAQPVDHTRLDSVLSESAENGALRRAVLAWDDGFAGTSGGDYFVGTFPDNEFGQALDQAVGPTVVVNVVVHYPTGSGTTERQRMVYNGVPGDNAVRSEAVVTVFDEDHRYDATGNRKSETLESEGLYPGISQRSGSDVYALLRVEVVAWRT
ncbi:DUF7288 family protein [Halosimplex halobium]|uniref:DUF7288 family protein n=1 Tax=Halosimplex halobium TaxID=3396618 RepID=UPI003F546322